MKMFLYRKKIKNIHKYSGECPSCEHNIVLDKRRFDQEPDIIVCYKCSTTFKVKNFNKRGQPFVILNRTKNEC